MRSCLSAIIPSLAAPLRPNQQKKRLSPSKPPPRLPTAATPRRGSFTYPAAVTSTARPARCVSNPRKRPAATDTNPANAVWPARADRLWKLAGVLGRSPDKGRPRFSSSPNLPAWFAPLLPPEIFDRREGRTTEIPLDAGEKIKSIGISVLAFSRRRALAEKPMGKKDGRRRNACFVF